MNRTQPSPTEQGGAADRVVMSRLAAAGVRYTRARRAVVHALQRAPGPMSAAEIHGEIAGAVPLSSLYRSLAVLEEAGVLAPHHGTRGLTRYEPAEWLSGHHHHLLCTECGAVEDIELDPAIESDLDALVAAVASRQTFAVTGHELEIEGVCAFCQEKL